MLDNTITLPVDVLGNGTLVNKVFTRYDEFPNRSVYVGPTNTMSLKDTLSIYRTAPKISGNSLGVAKSAAKFTQDFVVPGKDTTTTVTAPALGEFSFNIPVGVTVAQTLEFRQRMIALLDHAIAARMVDGLEY